MSSDVAGEGTESRSKTRVVGVDGPDISLSGDGGGGQAISLSGEGGGCLL
jgi:hypothetical protein